MGCVDVASATPREIIALRRRTLGYVSQFLRGFAYPYPAILLDEPTASLDSSNRTTVLAMIGEAKSRGAAIIGIFHDHDARDQVCDRILFWPGV